jgi:hypothetical protein
MRTIVRKGLTDEDYKDEGCVCLPSAAKIVDEGCRQLEAQT